MFSFVKRTNISEINMKHDNSRMKQHCMVEYFDCYERAHDNEIY